MTEFVKLYEYHITLSDGRLAVVWEYGGEVEIRDVLAAPATLRGDETTHSLTDEGIEQ